MNHPWRVLLVAALKATTASWYAASNLVLDADTNHLIGADRPFMIPFKEGLKAFGDLEYLYIVIDPEEGDSGHRTALDRRRRLDARRDFQRRELLSRFQS